MNANQNMKSGFSIEQQISAVSLSQQERNAVLHDARIAELIVGAIVWVGSKLQRSGVEGFAKLSPKY